MMATRQSAEVDSDAERLACIPQHLRIRILHESPDFVVIEKPCNLRSVPGHAQPVTGDVTRKRKLQPDRRTPQEAWALAIQSFKNDDSAEQYLQKLSSLGSSRILSVPRRYKVFRRYLERNANTLLGTNTIDDKAAKAVFNRILRRQEPLLNLPEPTPHEESALGQLILMGLGGETDKDTMTLRAVHRLDCQTSGVMVFAKNDKAAASLCQSWRERDKVQKVYLAKVANWPPFHKDNQREGIIDIPMEPSEERLKWRVATDDSTNNRNTKRSISKWKVISTSKSKEESSAILELTPVTGRTHQLRVHCAHVGSGIVGDSLYTSSTCPPFDPKSANWPRLYLHAWKLSFPTPNADEEKQTCTFSCTPSWYLEADEL